MTLEDFGILAEIISALAVMVTLVFLVFQMRQNTKALQAQSVNDMNNVFTQINLAAAANRDMARLYVDGVVDLATLDEIDQARFNFVWLAAFRGYEGAYTQYRLGLRSKESWAVQRDVLAIAIGMPGVRDWWQIQSETFSPAFVAELAEIAAGTGAQ